MSSPPPPPPPLDKPECPQVTEDTGVKWNQAVSTLTYPNLAQLDGSLDAALTEEKDKTYVTRNVIRQGASLTN